MYPQKPASTCRSVSTNKKVDEDFGLSKNTATAADFIYWQNQDKLMSDCDVRMCYLFFLIIKNKKVSVVVVLYSFIPPFPF